MLLYLLTDFARDVSGVRDRFANDPAAVLDDYNVKPADYKALLELPEGIVTLLPVGVVDAIRAIKDVPPPSLLWPGPTLSIRGVKPDIVAAGAPVTLAITIEVDPPDEFSGGPPFTVEVYFRKEHTVVRGAPVLPIPVPKPPVDEVTFDCLAGFEEAGEYQVDVAVARLTPRPFRKVARYFGTLKVREG
ncbi:hypothetical protein SAMN02745121_06194 [Nannocystis exedens]|uniref:Uncharacterized protein n=1 Tax=Nannocystis exedens TaxID=54 RepID=A0A1I2EQ68_9BACT|nr:hypothetical protein [Nannocystis exedens]PCC73886.1 hypothetical protein NAEX_06975 [Nannocystis exedens]SFE94777.1 hypothetical protein SAMN02745121_06194 [Nannocystis exedens]